MDKQVLMYSIGNYIQYPVTDDHGNEYLKRLMHYLLTKFHRLGFTLVLYIL